MNIWIILIGVMILSLIVQSTLQSRFNKYSQEPTADGLTGADVARLMLKDHGIYDVQVVPTNGRLTDHYNPNTKSTKHRCKRMPRHLPKPSSHVVLLLYQAAQTTTACSLTSARNIPISQVRLQRKHSYRQTLP